jgi:hypothetical protein
MLQSCEAKFKSAILHPRLPDEPTNKEPSAKLVLTDDDIEDVFED